MTRTRKYKVTLRNGLSAKIVMAGFLILLTGRVSAVVLCSEKQGDPDHARNQLLKRTKQYTDVRRKYPVISDPDAATSDSFQTSILVKFDPQTAQTLDQQLVQKKKSGQTLQLPDTFKAWTEKYKVTGIQRVLADSAGDGRSMVQHLKRKPLRSLTAKEKKILSRLKRIRGNPVIPEVYRLYRIRLDIREGQHLEQAIEEISSHTGVEYAQRNQTHTLHITADDPLYPLQWALQNTGQTYPPGQAGSAGSDIDMEVAWDIGTGDPEVLVAVVDTGLDLDHRDLQGNLWINEGEIPDNGMDDDGNGYVDDVYGYDFSDADSDPSDYYGHGTHCAGIIASAGNNGLDTCGVLWDAQLMAVKMFPLATDEAAFASIVYAADNGADVISCSWGPTQRNGSDPVLEEAVDYAYSMGCILVFSAGNNNDEVGHYSPANYSRTLAVAATDSRDRKASFSNYGSGIDIAAPGVDILSLRAEGTALGQVYDAFTVVASGTSMACPHVSGACALLLSLDESAGFEEIREILKSSGDLIADSPLVGMRLNAGRMAAVAAGQGILYLDREFYSCSDSITVTVIDADARGMQTVEAELQTDTGDYERIVLLPIQQGSSVFRGRIPTSGNDILVSDGILQTSDEDSVQVSYWDFSREEWIYTSAGMDCRGPVVEFVDIQAPGPRVVVNVKADESFRGRVRIGRQCGAPFLIEQEQEDYLDSHTFVLRGFEPGQSYYLRVECTDSVGNTTLEDRDGSCFFFTTTTPGGQIRVPDQYVTIQEAIDHAWEGDEVSVADGIYSGPGNYDLNFYGENITVRSENGPEGCILDCRAKGRGFVFVHGEDNRSVVDGFTIMNGWSQIDYDPSYAWGDELGGGIYCLNSTPTLLNCRFLHNYSNTYGGGLYAEHAEGQLIVRDCQFYQNQSGWGGGGACLGSSIFENCVFISNLSVNRPAEGGGLVAAGLIHLRQCSFLNNQAMEQPRFSSGNSYGGGAYLAYCAGSVEQCLFRENQAGFGGGLVEYSGQLNLINCLFYKNRAQVSGGGIWIWDSQTHLLHCTIADNESRSTNRKVGGGGITVQAGQTWIESSILWNNHSGRSFGQEIQALGWCTGYTEEEPYRCISSQSTGLSIVFSNIKKGIKYVYRNRYTDMTWGEGIVTGNPKFQFPEDYHLAPVSTDNNKKRNWGHSRNLPAVPAWLARIAHIFFRWKWIGEDYGNVSLIDGGTDAPTILLPENDLDGGIRYVNDAPDIGAFEYNPGVPALGLSQEALYFEGISGGSLSETQSIEIVNCSTDDPLDWSIISEEEWIQIEPSTGHWPDDQEITIRVDPSQLEAGNYYTIVQVRSPGAINDGRKIFVRIHVSGDFMVPGKYPTIQSAILAARNGETVLIEDGRYTGPGNRDIRLYGKGITVKSQNGPKYCVLDCQGTQEDPHRAFRFWEFVESEDPILEGVTIQNGFAGDDYLKLLPPAEGGGIFISGMKPLIRNCIFLNNYAVANGGGICTITGEREEDFLNPVFVGECIFSNNEAAVQGGGMFIYDRAYLQNCLFYENKALYGGGIQGLGCIQSMVNCTLSRNEAAYGGGVCQQDSLKGISFIEDDPSMLIVNSILWDNYAAAGPEIYLYQSHYTIEPPALTMAYSTIRQGAEGIVTDPNGNVFWGPGNQDEDPLFTSPGIHDFHLLGNSPCIDAGNGDVAPVYDLERAERFDDPESPNKGVGEMDYVDLGAFEFSPL